MKTIALILMLGIVALSPAASAADPAADNTQGRPSFWGKVWQDFKNDWIKIGRDAKETGTEVGRTFKEEAQQMPENFRKGWEDAKKDFKNGTGTPNETRGDH